MYPCFYKCVLLTSYNKSEMAYFPSVDSHDYSISFYILDKKGSLINYNCSFKTFKEASKYKSKFQFFRLFEMNKDKFFTYDYKLDNIYSYVRVSTLNDLGEERLYTLHQDIFFNNSIGVGMDAWYEEQVRNIQKTQEELL